MNETVELFFTKSLEEKMNEKILFYSFSENESEKYIEELLEIPLSDFIEYMDTIADKQQIESRDVFQFSNLDNATHNFCGKMKEQNNPGMKFIEIGKLLLDDGIVRKDGALTKYGENHAKTAEMLGLAFELCNTYYLSCIGYTYTTLSEEKQQKLLTRLILRNKLIMRLYQASHNGKVNMRNFLYMISDSTYIRRRSNIKRILNILTKSNEYEFSEFIDRIYYD